MTIIFNYPSKNYLPNKTEMIKIMKMIWAGHVAFMKNTNAYRA